MGQLTGIWEWLLGRTSQTALPTFPWKSSTKTPLKMHPSPFNILSLILNYSAVFIPSWTPSVLFLLSAFQGFISSLPWQLTSVHFPYEAPTDLLARHSGSSRNIHVNKIPSSNLEIIYQKTRDFKNILNKSGRTFLLPNFLSIYSIILDVWSNWCRCPLLNGSHHDTSNIKPRWNDSFSPFISNFLELLKLDAMILSWRTYTDHREKTSNNTNEIRF